MLEIYNTLTREKGKFLPLQDGKISMYVCGPTVYDVPHIGHIRSGYSFDVIRKYFEFLGYDVVFVRNVTDIDDKIIKKSFGELEENGEEVSFENLKRKTSEVATKYLEEYHNAMNIFGIKAPTFEPKATDNIERMLKFILHLIDTGYAYVSGGSVYFSVESFKEYGKLSNRNMEELLEGVRIDVDKEKRHPLDFALWKNTKKGEPFWESPWGQGRPGWHIECSAMSTEILGEEFDIHGGGLDLIFPHHENEIAQSVAATGKAFAKYWIHNGLLTVNHEKMSKSLGNFITVGDFLSKHKDPELLKLAFLNSHYRSPMDYSDNKMEEAANTKERISIFIKKVEKFSNYGINEISPKVISASKKIFDDLDLNFRKAMNDDFNTPKALAILFQAIRTGNEWIEKDEVTEKEKGYVLCMIKSRIHGILDIFGINLVCDEVSPEQIKKIEESLNKREEARKNKDYAESDKIREELLSMDIIVEDTPEGQVWRKK